MDKTIIMGVSIEPRNLHAVKVQDILTRHGCIIKTRLGLHETSTDTCSHKGIVLLQLCGEDKDIEILEKDLMDIEGVRVNKMEI
ncbi:hypothetical protein KQI86_10395 [Clostridium sp. MSJ-11]|uniref:Iron-only hydrogenase system regulator n=1 Tax=Clostridium mobile TaxID=2841512 RepID=A0ABS6EHM8_9CLOT|nr:hypothetical protein [Clostridium mobile]MBU5484743.1 hypothetical protein [Clostridium mobile]